MPTMELILSARLRASPFEQRALECGATWFSIYNKMTLPLMYRSLAEDYAHLKEHVQVWDVACQRQVEAAGPDALRLMELVTPRDLSGLQVGQGVYAPLVDEDGGIVNDPIILRVAEDRYWASIADSDAGLWMRGIAWGRGLDVRVFEPDVSPLAVQGPKADALMTDLVGAHVRDIPFFWFSEEVIANTPVLLARSGWSGQGGYEIYLQDSTKALDLWDTVWAAGLPYNVRAGCPNSIERLETGLMSYGADMTRDNNPLECGFERYINLDKKAEYMSREALARIAAEGIQQKLVKLAIAGEPFDAPRDRYDIVDESGSVVGIVTSQGYSPKFASIIAFAQVQIAYAMPGTQLQVLDADGKAHSATVRNNNWSEAR